MSDEQNEIQVFESRRFEKALAKLSQPHLAAVEDEIEEIISNPEIGTSKKGDLAYLRVHKFNLDNQQVLLGYTWIDDRLELYLLHLAPHENFYINMKQHRKADLKLVKP
jgi:mRNA-degrading endonuclease RelE of RelBE toxin-antitoxin system